MPAALIRDLEGYVQEVMKHNDVPGLDMVLVHGDQVVYNWQVLQLSLIIRRKIKPERISPFLAAYHNDTLGEVNLRLHEDNSLWVDLGKYESSIRPLILEENQFIFFESVFFGKTITLDMDSDGSPTMHWRGDEAAYSFHR